MTMKQINILQNQFFPETESYFIDVRQISNRLKKRLLHHKIVKERSHKEVTLHAVDFESAFSTDEFFHLVDDYYSRRGKPPEIVFIGQSEFRKLELLFAKSVPSNFEFFHQERDGVYKISGMTVIILPRMHGLDFGSFDDFPNYGPVRSEKIRDNFDFESKYGWRE